MRKKTEKKLVSFTNLRLVDDLVKDEAGLRNISESAVIEERLLDSFLPKNNQARSIVVNFLYAEDGGIWVALNAVFRQNAAGINWKSVYSNFLPLVNFGYDLMLFNGLYVEGSEVELYHLKSQLDSLAGKFEQLSSIQDDVREEWKYIGDAKYARELLKGLEENPKSINLINVWALIIERWDVLFDWSITFRLLADLSLLANKWQDYPNERIKLLHLIDEVSAEWKEL